MLPHAKDIKACFVCQLSSSNNLLQPLLRTDLLPGMAIRHQIAQGINAELKCRGNARLHVVVNSHNTDPLYLKIVIMLVRCT
ncbi:hypothetical protein D3C76_1299850 [compost metagenome]